MKISPLTSMEEQIMQLIWSLEKPYLRDIMQALPEPKSHQNTVSTYLKILIQKDYLRTQKEGRIFRYIPRVDKDIYLKKKLELLAEEFFEGSTESLYAFMHQSFSTLEKTSDSAAQQTTIPTIDHTKSEEYKTNVAKKVATKTAPKKSAHKKYEQQIAAFVSGLEKVNKKKKKSKKAKSTSSKKKDKKENKDKKVKKEKGSNT